MATINDKLEQQNAQTRELTDDELNQATGGYSDSHPGLLPGGCPRVIEPIEPHDEYESPL